MRDVGAVAALVAATGMLAGCSSGSKADDSSGAREPAALPTELGPFETDTLDIEITLGERALETVVVLPVAAAPLPLVLFNHGFGSQGAAYLQLLVQLASHGFVVVAPTYDTFTTARTHVELMEDSRAVVSWVLEQAQSGESEFRGRVMVDAVGLAGHSRGGKQSAHHAAMSSNIDALFLLDPVDSAPPFGDFDPADYPSVAPELMANVSIPTGFVGAGKGGEGDVPCAPTEDNYSQFFASSAGPSFLYEIAEMGHADFQDACAQDPDTTTCTFCAVGTAPADDYATTAALATAFLRVFLAGDESYRPWVDGDEVSTYSRVQLEVR